MAYRNFRFGAGGVGLRTNAEIKLPSYPVKRINPQQVELAWHKAAEKHEDRPEAVLLPTQYVLRVDSLVRSARSGWEVRKEGGGYVYYYRGARVMASRLLTEIMVLWPGDRPDLRATMVEPTRCATMLPDGSKI